METKVLLFFSIPGYFHLCDWWSFTGIRGTESLLGSPGLFSVFGPISVIFLSEWFRLFHWFPILLVTSLSLCGPFQELRLQLVSSSPFLSSLARSFFYFPFVVRWYCKLLLLLCPLLIFIPALIDCFSLKSEWKQVSSGLQNSSHYNNWS